MQAAYDAAREAGVAEQVGRQLERLQSVARMVPELTRLLKHPTMTVPRKLEATAELLDEELLPAVRDLLALVVEHDRGEVLQVAGEVYREVADEAEGVVRARATTALPLDGERADRIRAALARWFGAEVVLEQETDPDIIGGVVVEVGDRVVDGSLRGRLLRMRAALAAG